MVTTLSIIVLAIVALFFGCVGLMLSREGWQFDRLTGIAGTAVGALSLIFSAVLLLIAYRIAL